MEKGWTRLDVEGVPPGKQGKFDRVYEGPNGEIHGIESKGVASGEATFTGRMDVNGLNNQQGTPAYSDDIISILRSKPQAQVQALIEKIDIAKLNDSFEYILVEQRTLEPEKFAYKIFPE